MKTKEDETASLVIFATEPTLVITINPAYPRGSVCLSGRPTLNFPRPIVWKRVTPKAARDGREAENLLASINGTQGI